MDRAVPDCLITGYEELIDSLTLPDPDDRHVLAAAIVGHADVIVTWNVKDFPSESLEAFDILVETPDTFVSHVLDLGKGAALKQVANHRAALRNPPKSVDEYLDTLEAQGLVNCVLALRGFEEVI